MSLAETAAQILQEWAAEATEEMKANLAKQGVKKNSTLYAAIAPSGVVTDTTSVSIKWDLPEYAVYVNYGVKGLQNKVKTFGSFAFKNKFVGRKMVDSIADWISRGGIKVRQNRQQSTKSVLSARDSMAFAMARSIKMKGLRGTKFYTDVLNEEGIQKLADRLSEALGKEIEVNILSGI